MWITISLVIAISILLTDTASGVQEFDAEPADTEANPLQSVRLTCRVRSRKGECVWLKNRRVVGKIPGKYQFSREPADGDCSVTISTARLEEDDGLWQCQVTMASLEDLGLESREAQLTIREPPQPPRLEEHDTQVAGGERLAARAGEPKKVRCVSRMGNPPAFIRWFLGNEEITHSSAQTNASDVAKPRTFTASSLLHYTFEKADNSRTLSCRAYHGAYADASSSHPSLDSIRLDNSHQLTATAYKEIVVSLDVMYRPTARLEGNSREDIEEGANLTLRCVADANPPANIVWRKSGQASIFDIKERISFRAVQRSDSGVYSCSAKNDMGDSPEMQVVVDVKYKPRIVRIEPPSPLTFDMKEQIRLTCVAEGNPTPKISWLQRFGRDPKVWNMRGRESTLVVSNASYAYQGVYICEAANEIKGKLYRVQSQEARVDIKGPPQVMTEHSRTRDRVVAGSDDDALLAVFFCADPRPRDVTWSWGSQSLLAGKTLFRYVADPLIADEEREDCYEARLTVRGVQKGDSRRFSLNVTNDRGTTEHIVELDVREPVSMSLVMAVTAGGVAFLLLFLTILVYLIRSEKMCFSRKYNATGMFKNDPNSDSGSASSGEQPSGGHNTSRDKLTPKESKNVKGNQSAAIPPDALYAGRSGQVNGQANGQAQQAPSLATSGVAGAYDGNSIKVPVVQFQGQRPPPPNVTTVSVQQF
ncbi:kin of IRRE-like protein 2 isoform X2 [Varroa destructor]|uniref:Ig-like domain-containing protein n=1 Tax=Varroa destructor TaxID=109461 RepID=A0A7M7KH08_VARDE|nr:kin of IRRE-like protein 2 isoform X2 [Varroa destructor]